MDTYINFFLKTELTGIPRLLDKYLGRYYNNTLCNGITWMFIVWLILHALFDDFLGALLQKMKCKKYVSVGLQRSLWYIGFYTTACIYCVSTLHCNSLKLLNFEPSAENSSSPSSHLILGFIVILTFYLHSACWEMVKYQHGIMAGSHFCLFILLCMSFFLRFIDCAFRLAVFTCSTHIILEVTRCIALMKKDILKGAIMRISFITYVLVFLVNYLILIPAVLAYPLIKEFSESFSIPLTAFIIWLIFEIYSSVPFKALLHLSHRKTSKNCGKDVYDCSLFPPRSDASYNFWLLRKEMQEREEECSSRRKPKGRNMVYQTLKCMVAIKRKLSEKRQNRYRENSVNDIVQVNNVTDQVEPNDNDNNFNNKDKQD